MLLQSNPKIKWSTRDRGLRTQEALSNEESRSEHAFNSERDNINSLKKGRTTPINAPLKTLKVVQLKKKKLEQPPPIFGNPTLMGSYPNQHTIIKEQRRSLNGLEVKDSQVLATL